jgi:ADP-ribosylglycohydrolase
MSELALRITNSALWAAYGDALGFITELADEKTVARRIKSSKVIRPVTWTRSIGGKFGATVQLPAGTYSDDTQLRLATSRSIDTSGHFDVEAFAKVELPVWLSYNLGAGVSTKAAAASLSSPNVNWFSNFYRTERSDYMQAGGNGAAMRIQPLVWSSPHRKGSNTWIENVIRNTISTHGHPRAIAGALFHAHCLKWALENKRPPSINEWREFNVSVIRIPEFLESDDELRAFWTPTWKARLKSSIKVAFEETKAEFEVDLSIANDMLSATRDNAFDALVHKLDAESANSRGSATKTALLAAVLAWQYRNNNPEAALQVAANHLFCDTDSIATMAGAILGCAHKQPPPGVIQDEDYIRSDAQRLATLADERKVKAFRYPDLLQWQPPRTQLEAVIANGSKIQVAALGNAQPISEEFSGRAGEAFWQWLRLDFGQTILAKQRGHGHQSRKAQRKANLEQEGAKMTKTDQSPLFPSGPPARTSAPSIHELTSAAIKSRFDPRVIGEHLLTLSGYPDGIELAIAYTAILAKALRARIEASGRVAMER